jgi:hypothetical protein
MKTQVKTPRLRLLLLLLLLLLLATRPTQQQQQQATGDPPPIIEVDALGVATRTPLLYASYNRLNKAAIADIRLIAQPTHAEQAFVDVVQLGGRTGHKMKDYLTGIVLHFLGDLKLAFSSKWIFPERDHNNHVGMFNLVDERIFRDLAGTRDIVYVEYGEWSWSGMAYEKFNEMITSVQVTKLRHPDHKVVLRLTNATRILLADVYNWEAQQHIPRGSFQRITDYIQARYYSSNERVVSTASSMSGGGIVVVDIGIHIRKGDVHDVPPHTSVTYYKNVIGQLKTIRANIDITIYSEKFGGYDEKDVYELRELEDSSTTINVVFDFCLYEYFSEMLSKRIFVPTVGQGSLSDMVLNYKERSTLVIVNHDESDEICYNGRSLRQRPKYVNDMGGALFETDANGYFDVARLQEELGRSSVDFRGDS